MKVGDIQERAALRQKFQCKSFHWYLEKVFPESIMLAGYNHIGEVVS